MTTLDDLQRLSDDALIEKVGLQTWRALEPGLRLRFLQLLAEQRPEQFIELLAVEVMGWTLHVRNHGRQRMWHYPESNRWKDADRWNPLTDWNHWREVEEKLLEGPWETFVTYLVPVCSVDTDWAMHAYASTNLRSRCLAALLSALSSPSRS